MSIDVQDAAVETTVTTEEEVKVEEAPQEVQRPDGRPRKAKVRAYHQLITRFTELLDDSGLEQIEFDAPAFTTEEAEILVASVAEPEWFRREGGVWTIDTRMIPDLDVAQKIGWLSRTLSRVSWPTLPIVGTSNRVIAVAVPEEMGDISFARAKRKELRDAWQGAIDVVGMKSHYLVDDIPEHLLVL
jgi:hypothetical protein